MRVFGEVWEQDTPTASDVQAGNEMNANSNTLNRGDNNGMGRWTTAININCITWRSQEGSPGIDSLIHSFINPNAAAPSRLRDKKFRSCLWPCPAPCAFVSSERRGPGSTYPRTNLRIRPRSDYQTQSSPGRRHCGTQGYSQAEIPNRWRCLFV
jgi:hypothetical protein